MSGTAEDADFVVLNATDIDARAAEWLQRRQFWNWNDQDQADLDAWLGESLVHQVAYWRLHAAWDRLERAVALRGSAQEGMSVFGRKRIWSLLAKITAGVVMVAAIGAGATYFLSEPSRQTYATALGDHEIVTLADGSQIELNTDTVVQASVGPNERRIWLYKGEAYFQIKHDPTRRLVVIAGDHRIVDLGTKFVVRRDAGRVKVALVEGRARFESSDIWTQKHSAVLMPGDVAIANANSISVTREPIQKVTAALGWRQGVLVFSYVTLADAAAEFNRYNRKKIVITDPAVARMTIAGTFPTNGVPLFDMAAQRVFGLSVGRRGDEIVISR
jgi:transmembrane sensor